MKIVFLGDSITQGSGVINHEDCYVELVKNRLGARVLNAGMGSTRISRSHTVWEEPHWHVLDFNVRAQALPPDCDFCFVFGGTNDYGDGDNPVGNENDDGYYTFAGAVNRLVDYLVNKYGRDKVVFIIPCHRYSENGHKATFSDNTVEPFPDFVNMLIRILDNKKIQYIDLYNDPALPKPTSVLNEGSFRDGLHPNEKGHSHIADMIINYIKNKTM